MNDTTPTFDLDTGKDGPVYVGISPTDAVRAAYAQSLNDWNTWTYSKYPVIHTDLSVTCGNFIAWREQTNRQGTT